MLRCDSSAMIRSKKPDVERLEALHHRRVGGEVDALVPILDEVVPGDDDARLAGQELLEDVVGLLAELAAVAEEQDAASAHPARISSSQSETATRVLPVPVAWTRNARFFSPKRSINSLDGLVLVEPVDDPRLGATLARGAWSVRWKRRVPQAVLRVEAVDLARRLGGGLVPEPEVIAVGVVDEGPDAVLPLQAVGVTPWVRPISGSVAVFLASITASGLSSSPKKHNRRALPCGRGLVADGELLASRPCPCSPHFCPPSSQPQRGERRSAFRRVVVSSKLRASAAWLATARACCCSASDSSAT